MNFHHNSHSRVESPYQLLTDSRLCSTTKAYALFSNLKMACSSKSGSQHNPMLRRGWPRLGGYLVYRSPHLYRAKDTHWLALADVCKSSQSLQLARSPDRSFFGIPHPTTRYRFTPWVRRSFYTSMFLSYRLLASLLGSNHRWLIT